MNEPRSLLLRRLTAVVAGWSLCYAIYRGYYAAGGTFGVPGTPDPHGPFRLINAFAAIILVVAAVLPVVMLPLWSRRRARLVLLAVCWTVAVGCVMHALINSTQRVLSLAGVLSIDYPSEVWTSVDHRAADLQDLLLNEPWFLVEGLTFGALGWAVLDPGRRRRWWIGTILAATAVLTVVGLLSATGVIGELIIF
jgi:hypothetical protein